MFFLFCMGMNLEHLCFNSFKLFVIGITREKKISGPRGTNSMVRRGFLRRHSHHHHFRSSDPVFVWSIHNPSDQVKRLDLRLRRRGHGPVRPFPGQGGDTKGQTRFFDGPTKVSHPHGETTILIFTDLRSIITKRSHQVS